MVTIALCPFYRFERNKTLYCEGKNIKFPNKQERDCWMNMHCESWDFKFCSLYEKLLKKYE